MEQAIELTHKADQLHYEEKYEEALDSYDQAIKAYEYHVIIRSLLVIFVLRSKRKYDLQRQHQFFTDII